MKPLPKFIAIAIIVGVAVVGGKTAFSLLPKSEPTPVAVTPVAPVAVPAETSTAGIDAQAKAAEAVRAAKEAAQVTNVTPAPVTAAPPSGLTQPGSADAGLANILGTKK